MRNGTAGNQYIVLYDDRCDACRAGMDWVRQMDRGGLVRFVPLDEGVKSGLHPALQMDACRRLMHVVSPDHRVLVGWDAVTGLARLFPWTWIVGVIGGIGPFRWLGRHVYRWVADHRYGISRVMCRFTGVKRTGPKCKLGPP